jgi:hypothetical protein
MCENDFLSSEMKLEQEFQDKMEPLIYSFVRTDEKLCKLQVNANCSK